MMNVLLKVLLLILLYLVMIIMLVLLIAVMKTLVSVNTKTLYVMMKMLVPWIAAVLILDVLTRPFPVQINLAILLAATVIMDANGPL
jgi:hypothetical protein